jgi:hypothetical protein
LPSKSTSVLVLVLVLVLVPELPQFALVLVIEPALPPTLRLLPALLPEIGWVPYRSL